MSSEKPADDSDESNDSELELSWGMDEREDITVADNSEKKEQTIYE